MEWSTVETKLKIIIEQKIILGLRVETERSREITKKTNSQIEKNLAASAQKKTPGAALI